MGENIEQVGSGLSVKDEIQGRAGDTVIVDEVDDIDRLVGLGSPAIGTMVTFALSEKEGARYNGRYHTAVVTDADEETDKLDLYVFFKRATPEHRHGIGALSHPDEGGWFVDVETNMDPQVLQLSRAFRMDLSDALGRSALQFADQKIAMDDAIAGLTSLVGRQTDALADMAQQVATLRGEVEASVNASKKFAEDVNGSMGAFIKKANENFLALDEVVAAIMLHSSAEVQNALAELKVGPVVHQGAGSDNAFAGSVDPRTTDDPHGSASGALTPEILEKLAFYDCEFGGFGDSALCGQTGEAFITLLSYGEHAAGASIEQHDRLAEDEAWQRFWFEFVEMRDRKDPSHDRPVVYFRKIPHYSAEHGYVKARLAFGPADKIPKPTFEDAHEDDVAREVADDQGPAHGLDAEASGDKAG